MFFSFDGIDGAGKTTQIERFAEWLIERGHNVVVYRDPGSTELSERIRAILLTKADTPISDDAEMLLYMTARTQLLRESILPDLAAGKTVIIDRYVLATLAYQGHAGNVSLEAIHAVGDFATKNTYPVLTFVLDVDPNVSHQRRDREPDRMEERGLEYLAKVRQGFLAEAEKDDSIHVIDASQSIDEVQSSIRELAATVMATDRQLGAEQ